MELRRKTFKTTLNYKSDQNTMTCIDLMSKRSKQRKTPNAIKLRWICIDLTSKRSKQRKTPNAIKLRWICIDLTSKRSKMLSYVANHSKPLNYRSDQNIMTFTDLISKTSKQRITTKLSNYMNCIDLMSKRSKQRETTKAIKLRWIACIWHQNERKCCVRSQTIQNNAKLQKWSKYNDLHRFGVKTI